ncbi:hypothetical protein EXS65_00580 [Candidatus Peribacteria bacterium]|nr:hypothetical protein [Candidatus Peribacteria bacterium]
MDKQSSGNDGELAYHAHVLLKSKEADSAARYLAAETILMMTRQTTGRLDLLFADFLTAYQEADDERLKERLVCVIVHQWATRGEVHALLRSMFASQDLSDGMITSSIFSLGNCIGQDVQLIFDPGIKSFIQDSHAFLSRQETEEQHKIEFRAVHLLQQVISAFHAYQRGRKKTGLTYDFRTIPRLAERSTTPRGAAFRKRFREYLGTEDYQLWLGKLNSLAVHADQFSDPRLALQVHQAIRIMQKSDGAEAEPSSLAMGEFFLNTILSFGGAGESLDADEANILSEEIKQQGIAPGALLQDLFDEGASIVLLECGSDNALKRLPDFFEDMDDPAAVSHVAIDIPPSKQDAFERFLQGENPPEITSMMAKDEYILLRDVLTKLSHHSDAEFALVGTELSGELQLDELTRHLIHLLKQQPHAKVLRLFIPFLPSAFACSRAHQKSDDGTHFSVAPRLIEEFGDTGVASVITMNQNSRFTYGVGGFGEVGQFCADHSIIHSFGIRPGQTVLKDKQFEQECAITYGEAWDGVLVFLKQDHDKRSRKSPVAPPSSRVPVLT